MRWQEQDRQIAAADELMNCDIKKAKLKKVGRAFANKEWRWMVRNAIHVSFGRLIPKSDGDGYFKIIYLNVSF